VLALRRLIGFALLANLAHGQAFGRAPDPESNPQRLDLPPTPDDSVQFTFDDGGPTLRLPKVLFAEERLRASSGAGIKAKAVELVFWYPDMTPADWASTMDKYWQKQGHMYVPEKDRFRVHIVWMYFSDPRWDDLDPAKRPPMFGLEPRPPRIEMNLNCIPFTAECMGREQRVSSSFPGLDRLVPREVIQKHPETVKGLRHSEEGTYRESNGAAYELYMSCQSIECQAHVFSKTYRIQYRMRFATEAVAHTGELIGAIDRMIGSWSEGGSADVH